jgi:hypothetical protein
MSGISDKMMAAAHAALPEPTDDLLTSVSISDQEIIALYCAMRAAEATPDTDGDDVEVTLKAAVSNMGQLHAYMINQIISLIERVRKEAFEEGVKQVNYAIRFIERAEQRERCASIAWEYGREESDPLYKDFACQVADEIADRIRNASLAPGEQP